MGQKASDRNYRKEYDEYHGTDEQKKNRAKRNKARQTMEDKGKVVKGDGKDVDHKKPLRSGGSNDDENLRVTSRKKNRGWNKK